MKQIMKTKLIEACNAKDFQSDLDAAVREMQSLSLEVELSTSMCRAQKGVGYMYSAVVLGRQG